MSRTLRPLALALAAAATLPLSTATAQGAFTPGSKVVSVGLLSDAGTGVGGAFEYSLTELSPNVRLGVGAFLGYFTESVGADSYSAVPILATGNVHLALSELPALDLFAGISLGVVQYVYRDEMPGVRVDDTVQDAVAGFNIGARYYLTPTVGAFGQLGIGDVPEFFVGLSLKF